MTPPADRAARRQELMERLKEAETLAGDCHVRASHKETECRQAAEVAAAWRSSEQEYRTAMANLRTQLAALDAEARAEAKEPAAKLYEALYIGLDSWAAIPETRKTEWRAAVAQLQVDTLRAVAKRWRDGDSRLSAAIALEYEADRLARGEP